MKRIFKIVPCLLLSALTLVSACACTGDVSAMRRRTRRMQEQLVPQQEKILQEDPLDPDFLVETQTQDTEKEPETPDHDECPDCPKEDDEKEHPHYGKRPPRKGRRKHIKPVPYPLPRDDEEN